MKSPACLPRSWRVLLRSHLPQIKVGHLTLAVSTSRALIIIYFSCETIVRSPNFTEYKASCFKLLFIVMTYTERQSPRAAIREWLLRTSGTADCQEPYILQQQPLQHGSHLRQRYRQRGFDREHHHERSYLIYEEAQGSALAKNESHNVEKRPSPMFCEVANKMSRPTGKDPEVRYHEKAREAPRQAQHLGFHAPFQTTNSLSAHPLWGPGEILRRRRRQDSFSELSYMEPPLAKRVAKNRRVSCSDRHGSDQGDLEQNPSKRVDSRFLNESSIRSQTPENYQVRSLSVTQPAKTYERRPRRKTKSDRYEVKEIREQSENDALPTTRNKRREKSKIKKREPYEHAFSAQNVATDRLTVMPSPPFNPNNILTIIDPADI